MAMQSAWLLTNRLIAWRKAGGTPSALAAVGEKSVDALKSLLESNDPEIRSIAVKALAGGHATGPWPWPWPEPRPFPE